MSKLKYLPSPVGRDEARWVRYASDSVLATAAALLVTGIIYVFQLYPRIPNISLLYLLIVLTLASTRGLYSAIVASVVAFLSFDFFLTQPLYTFTIFKVEEWLALFIFLVTAIITGQLASALRLRAEQARKREYETRVLYEIVRDTNREENVERQLSIIARAVVDVFSSWGVRDCAILLPDASGKLVIQANTRSSKEQVTLLADEAATATWVMSQAQTAELHDVSLTPQGYAPRAVVRSTNLKYPMRRYVRMVPLKLGQRVV